jgi:hypothetical protein
MFPAVYLNDRTMRTGKKKGGTQPNKENFKRSSLWPNHWN